MKPYTQLQLGNFVFARYEIPEKINFGGSQRLVVHELVGGNRTVDSMGQSPDPIAWSGYFTGIFATERAIYLDGLRKKGDALELSWGDFSFQVVIKEFNSEFMLFNRLYYRIVCEVVKDLTDTVESLVLSSIEQAINGDLSLAGALVGVIGDNPLSSALNDVNQFMSQIGSITTAGQSMISIGLSKVSVLSSRVDFLKGLSGAKLSGVALGAISVAGIASAISASQNMNSLMQLGSVVCLIEQNFKSISAPIQELVVAGSNLYQIAADKMGDAMKWTQIASANGITDPQLSGINSIYLPADNGDSSGVLNV